MLLSSHSSARGTVVVVDHCTNLAKLDMRKTRLVIQPKRCLHTIGFLLLYLACPVIGDWGRIQPDTDMSHRAIAIAREGSRTLVKDRPAITPHETQERFMAMKNSNTWTRAAHTKQHGATQLSRRTEEMEWQRRLDAKREIRWLDARNQRLSSDKRRGRVDDIRERVVSRVETSRSQVSGRNLLHFRKDQEMLRHVPPSEKQGNSRRLLLARTSKDIRRDETKEGSSTRRTIQNNNSMDRRLLRERSTMENARQETGRLVARRQIDSSRRLLAARSERRSVQQAKMVETNRRETPQQRRLLRASTIERESRARDVRRDVEIQARHENQVSDTYRRQKEFIMRKDTRNIDRRREDLKSRSLERSMLRREINKERRSLPVDFIRNSVVIQSRNVVREPTTSDDVRGNSRNEQRITLNTRRSIERVDHGDLSSRNRERRFTETSTHRNRDTRERVRLDVHRSTRRFHQLSTEFVKKTLAASRREAELFPNRRERTGQNNGYIGQARSISERNKDVRVQTDKRNERETAIESRRRIANRMVRSVERRLEGSRRLATQMTIRNERSGVRNNERMVPAIRTRESKDELRTNIKPMERRQDRELGSFRREAEKEKRNDLRTDRRDSINHSRRVNTQSTTGLGIDVDNRRNKGEAIRRSFLQTNIRVKRDDRDTNKENREKSSTERRMAGTVQRLGEKTRSQSERNQPSRHTAETYRTLAKKSNPQIMRAADSAFGDKPYVQAKAEEMFAAKTDKWTNIKDMAANCVLGAMIIFLTSRGTKSVS